MTANTPSHLVPKLRFPKFEGAGDWEEKRLSSLVKLVSGVHLAPDMYSTTGEVPYFTGPSDFTDAIQCVAKWTTEPVNIAKQHDTLITVKGSGVGEIWYLTLPSIAMGRQLMAVRTEIGDRRFIYQFLSTRRAQFEALASGNLIPGLSRGDILGMAAYFPSRDEQQKIADCLGSLDDLIAAEGRKLEALRQHKLGLMQQLFPQPGETRPRLRFPEFEDAPDWEEVTLGTLLDRPPDYGANAAAVPFSESLPTYIRITDINDDGQFASRARVSVDIDATDEQYLEDGDIVLARTGASVGKSYRYHEEDGRLVYAGFLIRVRPNPERLLSQFLAGYLSTWSYWNWVHFTSERSGQPGINATEYASIPLPLPPDRRTLAEQQKIADCLTSIDDKLNAQARKLDTLKQQKQGLTQQLFPSLETE